MVNKSTNRNEYSSALQFSPEKPQNYLQICDAHHPPETDDPQGIQCQTPRNNPTTREASLVIVFTAVPIIFVAVTLGWIVVPCIIRSQIANKMAISPEANPELYSAWLSPPFPVYLKIYLFNITNSEQVRFGALPSLEQVGPYVFLENRTKIDVRHDETSDTITYNEYISYHFQPHMSGNAKLDDVVTIINVPFVAAAIKLSDELPWPIKGMALTLLATYREPLFVAKTVDEAVFKGWTVPFLQKIEEDMGVTLIPNNKFGLFMEQNDTSQGPYTVSRGTHDKSAFGRVLSFKNESTLNHWGDPSNFCNQVTGTDGSFFPPLVTKETTLWLFNAELCRSLYITYDKETSYEGINGYRFVAPQSVIADPQKSQENQCFCPDVGDYPEKCLRKGAVSLGPCRDGAPVALSAPYFLDADPEYITTSGLTPIRDLHQSFMDIEPTTGLVLKASRKLQISLILKKVKEMSVLKRVPEMLFPLIWAEEYIEMDAENVDKIKAALFQIWLFEILAKWGVLGIALVTFIVLIVRKLRVRKEDSHLTEKDNNSLVRLQVKN